VTSRSKTAGTETAVVEGVSRVVIIVAGLWFLGEVIVVLFIGGAAKRRGRRS
jgi:hypothetical protein